ncbi:MAG: PKD domain-containing protein [Bacteroidota bacterium]
MLIATGFSQCDAQVSYEHQTNMAIGFFTAEVETSCEVTNYVWDFGDGTFGSAQNPVHTFPSLGNYSVCLRVNIQDEEGDIEMIEYCGDVVLSAPVCSINADIDLPEEEGLLTAMNTSSMGIGTHLDSTRWEFGEGSIAIANQTQHQYTWSGIYEVCMTVYASNQNEQCQVTLCKPVDVQFTVPGFDLAIAHEQQEECFSTFKASRTLPEEVELIDRVWNVNGQSFAEEELELLLDQSMDIQLIETYSYRGQVFERTTTKFVEACEQNATNIESNYADFEVQVINGNSGVFITCQREWKSLQVFDMNGRLLAQQTTSDTYQLPSEYKGMVICHVLFEEGQRIIKKVSRS